MKLKLYNHDSDKGRFIELVLKLKGAQYIATHKELGGELPGEPILEYYSTEAGPLLIEGSQVIFEFLDERYKYPPLLPHGNGQDFGLEHTAICRMVLTKLILKHEQGTLTEDRLHTHYSQRNAFWMMFAMPTVLDVFLAGISPGCHPFWNELKGRLFEHFVPRRKVRLSA